LKRGPREDQRVYLNFDAWDGYEVERAAILQAFSDAGLQNVIALTGDLHCYIAAYLKVDYLDRSNRPGPNLVGVELMTPAITSATLVDFLKMWLTPDEFAELKAADARQPAEHLFENLAKSTNPHVRFFDGEEWGYSIVEFTPAGCTYTAYGVDTSVNSTFAPRRLVRKLRVPANQVRIEELA
jgi:alkaline phosphatase D